MSGPAALALRTLAAAVLLAALACETARPPVRDEPEVMYDEGFYLELRLIGEDNLAVLYRVNGVRELGFGGGMDAINRRISWQGHMTPDDYRALRSMLDDGGWFEQAPPGSGEPKRRVARIVLRRPGRTRHHKVVGRSDEVDALLALLTRSGRQRLNPDLESLPRPDAPEQGDGPPPGEPGG